MVYSILLFEIVLFSVKLNISIKEVIYYYSIKRCTLPVRPELRTGTGIFAHDSARFSGDPK
jgi:hypothetical protein